MVKNTLTRRAAEAAGADALLALLEGPTAIAFLEADGDMLAAAKALADMARESKVLAIRGGVLEGRVLTAEEVESLATLPPVDILRGQVLGAIIAPLTSLLGLVDRAGPEPVRPDRGPNRAAGRRGRSLPEPAEPVGRGAAGRRGRHSRRPPQRSPTRTETDH